MPELPEVETVRRVIEPQVAGARIEGADVLQSQVVAHPTPAQFAEGLLKRTIARMGRRGKYLLFHLDDGSTLVLHLRMTGCLLASAPDYPRAKHTHVVLHLSNGLELRYVDTRRFGRFWLLAPGEPDELTGMHKLGIEPFDEALTGDYLRQRLGTRGKPIKECLLDQGVVAGIGNIYGDEILHAAGIRPTKAAKSLTKKQWGRLAEAIPAQLAFFIEQNAVTPEEYLASGGNEYRSSPLFKAYGHAGEPCEACGRPFKRVTIGGRSSTYCPGCQK